MAARARRRGREARIEAESAPAEDNPPVWGGIEGGRFRPLSDADEA
ncbi:hypothetical protein [Leisingera sp. NJS204]|nr:hypothetical protein [Leisingera sp. NJS204]